MPGIGAYTAGAVLSIAYGRSAGSRRRAHSFARMKYEDVLRPQTIRQVTDIIREMMPDGQAGKLTEAIMELGALVARRHRSARCALCAVNAKRMSMVKQVCHFAAGQSLKRRSSA
ncbi:MAG: hypothetical protein ACLSB9_25055 [Hydrogeniiclostridium mannosilyticum]